MMEELRTGFDIHADNQKRFNLPERVLAKIFVFKLLYGGTAYGFAQQVEFEHISKDQKFWQHLIDEFYNKYKGVHKWHEKIVREVCSTGRLVMPTGREFHYPIRDVVEKLWYWRSKILNYPVQGTGADLVSIGRVSAWRRISTSLGSDCKWISTVHDSIDLDVPEGLDKTGNLWYNSICKIVNQAINDIPTNFYRLFGHTFNVPISAEIYYGPNLGELTEWRESQS